MSEIVAVDDTVTEAKIVLLDDKVREYDKKISRLNHIKRQLRLTEKYEKSVTATAGGTTTTTVQKMKRMDSQTDEIITDERRLEMYTLWHAKADAALA